MSDEFSGVICGPKRGQGLAPEEPEDLLEKGVASRCRSDGGVTRKRKRAFGAIPRSASVDDQSKPQAMLE
jgi:hypothetical protein